MGANPVPASSNQTHNMSFKSKKVRDTSTDRKALQDAGYAVKVYSFVHWRVFRRGVENKSVEVWPTAKKYMVTYGNGASLYTDIVKAVGDIFDNKPISPLTSDVKASIQAMCDFREKLDIRLTELGLL